MRHKLFAAFADIIPVRGCFIVNIACAVLFISSISAANIKDLSYKDPVIKSLRKEVSSNLRLSKKGFRVHVTWHEYRIKKGDTFFQVMAKTMLNHDTLSSVNRLASLWDVEPGDRWLVPNMRGVADFGPLEKLVKKYRVTIDNIYTVPGKKNLYFIPGKSHHPSQRNFFNLKAFIRPVAGVVSSEFGTRIDPFHNKRSFHTGIDIACNTGSAVKASAGGRVVFAGWNGGYGRSVIIEHENGFQTLYGHLSKINVKKNQKVKQGQPIADSGSTGRATGPHLHFEVRRKGRVVRPDFNRHHQSSLARRN